LSFISRADFEVFGESRPELYLALTHLLARRLRFTNDIVAATSFLSLKGRVARVLLNLAEEFGRDVGQGVSSFSRKSPKTSSPQWRASHGKMSAGFCTIG
jgi:CRP-like cAMP-binding protein